MPDYRKMYSLLFNEITNVIEQLRRIQIKTEELYMESEETPLHMIKEIGTGEESSEESPADESTDTHRPSNKT